LIWNWQAAYSGFIAGVICAIVNAFFAWRVFRHKGARAAKRFVLAFCFGEMMKLIMLGVLFVLAVLYLKLAMLPFLVSFIINLMIYWLAPFMIFGFIK
jgi:ATP synthase protein I